MTASRMLLHGVATPKTALANSQDLPQWPRSNMACTVRALLQAPAFAALGLLAPARVSGLEMLGEIEGPVLFAANHTSHLDTPVLLKALPPHLRRRVAVAAAADYFFSQPILGAAVALGLNAFPFERASCAGMRSSLLHCTGLVDNGWSILVYPEGTRNTGGAMAPFKPGLGLLATCLGVPVVPVYTTGLFHILPKGKSLPHPGRASIRFGQPLTFASTINYRTAAQSIEQAVRSLADSLADIEPLRDVHLSATRKELLNAP